jgi:hypothetical protein
LAPADKARVRTEAASIVQVNPGRELEIDGRRPATSSEMRAMIRDFFPISEM